MKERKKILKKNHNKEFWVCVIAFGLLIFVLNIGNNTNIFDFHFFSITMAGVGTLIFIFGGYKFVMGILNESVNKKK